MGNTIYQNCVKALEPFKGKTINFDELLSIIMKNIGSMKTSTDRALKVMAETGLIKDVGNSKFEIQ